MNNFTIKVHHYRLPLLLSVCLVAAACSTNPATGRSELVTVSSKSEKRIGDKLHEEIMQDEKQYGDKDWDAYVNLVGKQIAASSDLPEADFKFIVLDSEDINAFALPNAHIYITTGMLMHLNKESHLAAVLAHEIAHVTARHTARKITRNTLLETISEPISFAAWSVPVLGLVVGDQISNKLTKAQTVLVKGYGRELELQADTIGARYLAQAGYDPEDMIEVLGILKDQELYRAEQVRNEIVQEFELGVSYHASNSSTHPSADQRLREVIRVAEEYLQSDEVRADRENYMLMIDGLDISTKQKYVMDPDWTELHEINVDFKGYIPYTFEAYDSIEPEDDNVVQLPANFGTADYIALDSSHKVYRAPGKAGLNGEWESRYSNNVLLFHIAQRPQDRTPKEFLLEFINKDIRDIDYLDHQIVSSRFGDGHFIRAVITHDFSARAIAEVSSTKTVLVEHMFGVIFIGELAVIVDTYGGVFNFEPLMHKRIFLSVLRNIRSRQADDTFEDTIPRQDYAITLVQAEPGDTFASLAENILLNDAVSKLRLINGMYPSGEPNIGDSIKVFSSSELAR